MSYINSKEFSDILEKWVDMNDQTAAARLNSKKSLYPTILKTVNDVLYRGMAVDTDFIEKCKVGLKYNTFSSWTMSRKIAEKFAKESSNNPKKIKILIKKKIPNSQVILNIFTIGQVNDFVLLGHGFDEIALDSMVNEQEILVNKGVVIKLTDLIFL